MSLRISGVLLAGVLAPASTCPCAGTPSVGVGIGEVHNTLDRCIRRLARDTDQVSQHTSNSVPIGEQLAAVFEPALRPLGFGSPVVSEDAVLFDGAQVRFEAAYVARDGELAVYVIPHGGDRRLQLLLYLRAIGSPAASDLGEADAESAEAALRHAAIYAAAIPDAALLLVGDPAELARARDLRWWDASP